MSLDRQKYERDLVIRQHKHLENLQDADGWHPCMHDQCPTCHGTGIGRHGACIHMMSCPCPKCTTR